jgi:hypothetical protein
LTPFSSVVDSEERPSCCRDEAGDEKMPRSNAPITTTATTAAAAITTVFFFPEELLIITEPHYSHSNFI